MSVMRGFVYVLHMSSFPLVSSLVSSSSSLVQPSVQPVKLSVQPAQSVKSSIQPVKPSVQADAFKSSLSVQPSKSLLPVPRDSLAQSVDHPALSRANDVVVQYCGIVLRCQDLDTVNNHNWLNDQVSL